MLKIKVLKDKDNYKKITFNGHCNFDDYGKDIVCSAISSIVITTENGIQLISKDSIKTEELNNKIIINILDDNNIVKLLLDNMLMLLRDLENKYPKNLKIEEE